METTAVEKDRADKAEQKEELLLNDETVAEKGATLKLLACENCNIKLNDNVYDSGSARACVWCLEYCTERRIYGASCHGVRVVTIEMNASCFTELTTVLLLKGVFTCKTLQYVADLLPFPFLFASFRSNKSSSKELRTIET